MPICGDPTFLWIAEAQVQRKACFGKSRRKMLRRSFPGAEGLDLSTKRILLRQSLRVCNGRVSTREVHGSGMAATQRSSNENTPDSEGGVVLCSSAYATCRHSEQMKRIKRRNAQ